jgi:hypothetical protein
MAQTSVAWGTGCRVGSGPAGGTPPPLPPPPPPPPPPPLLNRGGALLRTTWKTLLIHYGEATEVVVWVIVEGVWVCIVIARNTGVVLGYDDERVALS